MFFFLFFLNVLIYLYVVNNLKILIIYVYNCEYIFHYTDTLEYNKYMLK